MIIGAMTIAGFNIAERYIRRCRLLKIWIYIMDILRTEIFYHARMLPEVFDEIAVFTEEYGLDDVFKDLAKCVEYGSENNLAQAWKSLLKEDRFRFLHANDFMVLYEIGNFIGTSDRQDQLQHIEACRERLRLNLDQAEIEQKKNVGIFRYLGFAVGTVVVLFII